MTRPVVDTQLVERCTALLERTDADLGAELLGLLPTHELRPTATLRQWAGTAGEFGAELADQLGWSDVDDAASELGLPVLYADGGVGSIQLTLAEYVSRPPAVRIFDDAITFAGRLVDALDWHDLFPADSIRAVAVCHELVHRVLDGPQGTVLKRRLGHVPLRLGPIAIRGHVLGADEVVAHGCAQVVCGLPRSPLLLTAALREALRSSAVRQPVHSGKGV